MSQSVTVYDTTLRDGCQGERVAFSVEDKLRVAHRLDALGVAFIEGGWPSEAAPRDREFFQQARGHRWEHARICAFGSTRRGRTRAEEDQSLRDLVASGAAVIAIFGKSWNMHATDVLRVSLEENLRMIEESVAFLKVHTDQVFFDAEHYFDGYKADPAYALKTLEAALTGGADLLCLCDTNGGCLPWEIAQIVSETARTVSAPLGIHCHNDSGTAVANSLEAVRHGCVQVQGTINGYGERAGNANLCELIPNLELKLGLRCLPEGNLRDLRAASKYVAEQANLPHNSRQAYVGDSAFAHKGGMHVNAVLKRPDSFEHVAPELVGNERRVLVSDMAGTSTVASKLQALWPDLDRKDPVVRKALERVKELEHRGYEFEAAEASFELLAQELRGRRPKLFSLRGYRVLAGKHEEDSEPFSEATVEIDVAGKHYHTAAKGTGPVHALDEALRKALRVAYPRIEHLELMDYKVRVLEGTHGTSTGVRVVIETSDGEQTWGTVGVHPNIIEASWKALVDSIAYGLQKGGSLGARAAEGGGVTGGE